MSRRSGRIVLLALASMCIVLGGRRAAGEVPMTLTVVPRSESGVFRDTTLVYLDGRIDDDVPARLSEALDGIDGKIAIWLNSPGGNLFAGMELGRVIRRHGARTHIIDHRTLRPGKCYSACAVAFLGGVHRYIDSGARYGVHRASLSTGSAKGAVDLAPNLTAAVESYMREMGVDIRLLHLWMKAGPDEMYVLSRREAKALRVADDGRMPPRWSAVKTSRGSQLRGGQTNADGTGEVSFSCDDASTILESALEAAGQADSLVTGEWIHLLTVDRHEGRPLKPLEMSREQDVVRWRFTLPKDLVRLAMSAKRIGHQMRRSGDRSTPLGYSVDIDARSASMVKNFLGDCLRRQAKRALPP